MKLFKTKPKQEQEAQTPSWIKVLGSGCTKCETLEEEAKKALIELNMEPIIEHVSDFAKIASYGVMRTPALVIDDVVVAYGRVLTSDEIVQIIKERKTL